MTRVIDVPTIPNMTLNAGGSDRSAVRVLRLRVITDQPSRVLRFTGEPFEAATCLQYTLHTAPRRSTGEGNLTSNQTRGLVFSPYFLPSAPSFPVRGLNAFKARN